MPKTYHGLCSVLILCLLAISLPAKAGAPASLCDRLGQHPLDDFHLKHNSSLYDLKFGPDAVNVCRKALAAHPNDTRFRLALGRALLVTSATDEALEVLRKAAPEGNTKAQLHLGNTLYSRYLDTEGETAEAYKKEACGLLQRAAQKGFAAAQYKMNDACDGDKTYLLRAVDGGSVEAMHKLASLSEWKYDESKRASDKAIAIKYYLMAANQGDTLAASQLEEKFGISPAYDVARIQRLLSEAGFDAGSADGRAGTKTKRAIEAFKKVACCPKDGIDANLIEALLKFITVQKFEAAYGSSRRIVSVIDACDEASGLTLLGLTRTKLCPEKLTTWKKFQKHLARAQSAEGELWRHHGLYGICSYLKVGKEPTIKGGNSLGSLGQSFQKLMDVTQKATMWLYWTEGDVLYSASTLHAAKFNRWRILRPTRGNFNKHGRVTLYVAEDMDDGREQKFGFKKGTAFIGTKGTTYALFQRCAKMNEIEKIKNLWGTVEVY